MLNTLLYEIATKEIGVAEIAGLENNFRILHYAKKAGLNWVKDDETSWCGIFMGFCFAELPEAIRPKHYPKQEAARARSWLDSGAIVPDLNQARTGDVLIFWRGSPDSWQGHVCLYDSHEGQDILCLGGNQGNMVKRQHYKKDRLLGIRRY